MTMSFLTTILWASLCMNEIQGWVSNFPTQASRASSRPFSPAVVSLSAAAAAGESSASNDYNVVLKPSEDPAAFDSFKIGSARVHRYSRDADSDDSGTEYVMWYHGRSHEMEASGGGDATNTATSTSTSTCTLPPLSTGRIGRATSKNGLIWEKQLTGSFSEDAPDVNLGLNKESWWGFDTAHVGLGNVLLPMSTPAVMTQGGVYLMYYMGGNFEETLTGDYFDKEQELLPENMPFTKVAGMKMRIGVALSQDGIAFGRVEGDDPTGACMVPFDKSDPNLETENVPLDMDEELYCAWPEVAVDISADEASKFLMFYSTMTKDKKQQCLAYAISPDGFKWTKKGVCLRPDDEDVGGLDAAGCARCHIVRGAKFDEDLDMWEETESWTMYYEGISAEDGKHRIMMAQSDDLRQWTKLGMALDVGGGDGDSNAWDTAGVGSPHIIRMDDGSERMYYTGQGADGSTAVGVAKLPDGADPNAWIREQATFAFE